VAIASETIDRFDHRAGEIWLFSEASDFWLVCAGGGILLVVLVLVLHWWGGWELGIADILLGELHLGATYSAVASGQLWRRMPLEVVAVPLAILAVTYALTYGGYSILVATAVVYVAAWHRGRQNLGIARFYQHRIGGQVSSAHSRLFQAAVYLPMVAGVTYFAGTSPDNEGEAFIGLSLDPVVFALLGAFAAASLVAYLGFTACCHGRVHPAERWLVIANALAFGSAYVLGASNASFILVLALHHEIQYLYFTYAVARSAAPPAGRSNDPRFLASFAVWPVIGLATWAACKFSDLTVLAPFLVGGLLCHYWLDSRIWTARARRLARR